MDEVPDRGQKKHAQPAPKDGMRETIESVAVAFVLAFLFRAFEAEAFVIPTGSMAPTLYGRHKDVTCEHCGYHFEVGASDEVNESELLISRIETALCPNCRSENSIRELPVFKGDRILVNKFPYEFGKPSRFDVAVFKYPEEPKTNYIKRIVGLPSETIVIKRGDLYRRQQDGTLEILRKDDPDKQRELQILVYDNDFPEKGLHERGWPHRWAAVEQVSAQAVTSDEETIAGWRQSKTGWNEDEAGHSFRLDGNSSAGEDLRWLRYRHIVPTPADWEAVAPATGTFSSYRPELRAFPRPQLITDLCGYNAYTGGRSGQLYRDSYWVGDLTLSVRADIQTVADGGTFILELNEGTRAYRCRIDVISGKAELILRSGLSRDRKDEKVLATAETSIRGKGRYRFRFANVDQRLCLWINNTLVDFGPEAAYEFPETSNPSPQDEDLIPAGIAAQKLNVVVDRLLLERDIYYRSEHVVESRFDDFPEAYPETTGEPELRRLFSDPQAWYQVYQSGMRTAEFELGPEEYLVLGDNSPRSKDSRLWSNTRHARHRYAVPASALIGKAFFIYWPHGIPFLRDGEGFPITYHKEQDYSYYGTGSTQKTNYPDFRIPFYPHVTRMHRIR